MHSHNVNLVEHALNVHQLNELRVNWRNTAQYDLEDGVNRANLARGQSHHFCEFLPLGVQMEVPVREIIGLVPEHYSFNHPYFLSIQRAPLNSRSATYSSPRLTSPGSQIQVSSSGCEITRSPALRSIPSIPPQFGIHQFVWSPEYLCSMKYMAGKSRSKNTSSFQNE